MTALPVPALEERPAVPVSAAGGCAAAGRLAPGGGRVRRVTRSDRAGLAAMFGRCSCETRYRRFHSPVRAIPERYLAGALAGRPDHYALAATTPSGAITALASCCTVLPGTVLPGTAFPGTAELGLLVEDASQGLGLGSFLLQELVRYSERAGHTVLTATILREQAWIIRLLRAYGTCATAPAHEALVVTVHLPDRHPHSTS